MTDLPELNRRIRFIIDVKCNRNGAEFARIIGTFQQRVNRIFVKDKRTGKYPSVPVEFITGTAINFPDINLKWLLTGSGSFHIDETEVKTKITNDEKDYVIGLQRDLIKSLRKEIEILKKSGKDLT